MAVDPDLRLKIRHFFQRNKKILIIIFIVLFIIIMINRALLIAKKNKAPTTTYTPNVPVLGNSSNKEVPEKVSSSFEDFIDKYVIYCNTGDYVKAYNLISDDCKKNFFNNNYNTYVEYVKQKFGAKKRYAIQNYSNYNDKYIYSVKIFNDFLATGLTNEPYRYQEEKITASYDENKNIVFSVGNYIESQKLQYMAANEYMKVDVTNAIIKYNFIIYTVKIANRSDYTIVIKDDNADNMEVALSVEGDYRECQEKEAIILEPGETKTIQLSFEKFFDTDTKIDGIVFNAVRIMENYTGNEETAQEEIDNAVDKFSMAVGF